MDFARRDALLIRVDRSNTNPEIGFEKLETVAANPLRTELEQFVDCVKSRRPPVVGGREGRAALALAERVMNCIEVHAEQVQMHLGGRALGHPGES